MLVPREVQQEEALCAAEATRLKLNAANNAEQTKSESLRRCNREAELAMLFGCFETDEANGRRRAWKNSGWSQRQGETCTVEGVVVVGSRNVV
jgi:hypothetical protein